MQIESFYDIVVFTAKCLLVAGSVYFVFWIIHFLDRKFTEIIPRLPKIVLYVLIVIFGSIWVFAKLLKFKVIGN